MVFSPQSQAVYRILLKANRPLTAKDLGSASHLSPSLVYRLTEPLIKIGLISKTKPYPYLFKAKTANEGLSLFSLTQNEWFSKQFFSDKDKTSKDIPNSHQISFSFIQSREELMSKSTEELARATKTFDILRSGHEIPADTMLAMFEAKKRGVKIRMLIQDYSNDTASQVKHWIKNGILVRKTSLHRIRIMIYDSSIAYFMSYKHEDSSRDLGMKVNYSPLAVILANLFNEWWQKQKEFNPTPS